MGIRESLLNTITSVGNSDFVRIVTSAGASSKATLANVFKSFESGLGAKSSLTTSDYIRVVGSDNVSYKQLVSDVAKKIIENYTGSSLAGSSQSVKSALDSLNSKTGITITVANTVTDIQGVLDSAYEQIPIGGSFGAILWLGHGYYPFLAVKPNLTRGYVNMWYAVSMYSLVQIADAKTYCRFIGSILS